MEANKILIILLFMAPLGFLHDSINCVLRITFNKSYFLILNLGIAISTLIIVLLVTQYIESNVLTLFKLYFINWAIFALIGIIFIRKWLVLPIKLFNLDKKLLSYGIPMALILLITSGMPFIERYFTTIFFDSQKLGIYAAGAKIAMLIVLPIGIFQTAFGPYMMKNYKNNDSHIYFNAICIILSIILSIIISIVFLIDVQLVKYLAGEKYIDAHIIILPLLISYYFQAIGSVTGIGTIITNKTYIRLIIYIIALVIGIFFMLLNVRSLGIIGVAYGVLISKITMFVLESFASNKLFHINWDYKMLILINLNFCMLVMSIYNIKKESSLFACITISIISIGYFAYLILKFKKEFIR